MKRDYKKIWWKGEEEEMTLNELAIGLLFCAGVISVCMGAFWIKGYYYG